MVSADYPILRVNARQMRNNPTEAERFLWNVLRGNRFGVKFRRQHVIGDYIADFACISRNLVIEIDGGYHDEAAQQQADEIRTQHLNEHGFKVVRFTNGQVLYNLDDVIITIEKYVNNNF